MKKLNLTGKKFGRLVVIKDTGKRKNKKIIWLCRCDCGNYCEVTGGHLKSGHTKSCGCLKIEISKNKLNKINRDRKVFIKKDHTDKEIKNYLNSIHKHGNDYKWNKLSKYLRKNSKCTICGSIKKLQVHHINGYNEFPEQRYDINNLVVICNSCHQKYHSKYKATKENWNKWIKEIKC